MDYWICAGALYLLSIIVSFWPVALALAKKVELNPGGATFDESPHFDAEHKNLLKQHYSRIMGTLGYWKNQASLYKAVHHYCLIWTIPSAVVIPVLTPFIETGNASKATVTLISAMTAILFAFHRGLKVEDNLRAYRHGESEFYDLVRRLLDRPESMGENQEDQLAKYFDDVERVRRFVRNAETDNLGTLDEAKTELAKRRVANKPTLK